MNRWIMNKSIDMKSKIFTVFMVCYPPDERMRNIHMWPSYEDLQEIRNVETIKSIE